jgi:hypothetical protein
MKYILLVLGVLVAGYALFRLVVAFRAWLRFRGQRLVTCPETKQPAAVRVAAGPVAVEATVRKPHLRLSECSRWPERQGCGQDCLSQVQADPENCLVWNIVTTWYEGQECVYCHKPFGHIEWHDHRPALMDVDRKTVQWSEVAPEKLPEAMATHWPVCWNCHIAETLRREHPELVTDRNRQAS